jgi:hypothetical protein
MRHNREDDVLDEISALVDDHLAAAPARPYRLILDPAAMERGARAQRRRKRRLAVALAAW